MVKLYSTGKQALVGVLKMLLIFQNHHMEEFRGASGGAFPGTSVAIWGCEVQVTGLSGIPELL